MAKLLSVRLREKNDRSGKKYLFGSVPELNCVVFVYDETKPGDADKSFELCVKPYGQLTVVEESAPEGGQRVMSFFLKPSAAPPDIDEGDSRPPARAAR